MLFNLVYDNIGVTTCSAKSLVSGHPSSNQSTALMIVSGMSDEGGKLPATMAFEV
jgi:hypothetical protein